MQSLQNTRSLMQLLRTETRAQHEKLESDLRIEDRISSADDLRNLLARFYGYYAPWERMADESSKGVVREFIQQRSKRRLLEEDLHALGLTNVAELPQSSVLAPRSESELLGSFYVLEGSTLGGQFIARMIENSLGLKDGCGYSFFRSYGADIGRMWRTFGEFMEANGSDEEDAVRGARRTFEEMHCWLCEIE